MHKRTSFFPSIFPFFLPYTEVTRRWSSGERLPARRSRPLARLHMTRGSAKGRLKNGAAALMREATEVGCGSGACARQGRGVRRRSAPFRSCSSLSFGLLEPELELIQSHMAQKPVLRGEVGCACVAREVSVERGGMGERGCARRLDGWVWV